MVKKAREEKEERVADRIIRGLEDALEIAEGRKSAARVHTVMVPSVDVKLLREKLEMSQEEFAMKFAFSLATVRNWEQERVVPSGPARTLLMIIDREPEAALRAVTEAAAA